MSTEQQADGNSGRHQFGTFGGVFTPSILTILGVIMFLRAGFVTGRAGIGGAILILAAAEGIALLTSLSMAAVSTNTPVKGGGAYYLISRALGPEFGGAIGLALFLAQALSVPFYLLGFSEALTSSFPALGAWFTLIALGTALTLFAVNLVGTGWAIKTQYIVMTILVLAIVSFLGGAVARLDPAVFRQNWGAAYGGDHHFWTIFAIYFPAVTGIMAGVNMSGDLKDPGRSLVRGTMAAVAVGTAVYLAQILLCGGSQTRAQLINQPYETLLEHAFAWRGFVMGGVFAATLSSAMGSFLGAPRVLQALARDRIFPWLRPFASGSKKGDEPRAALWLTLLVTLSIVWVASRGESRSAFDMVAAVVAMFFLCTYGMVNMAAFVESFGRNPSFRPTFRYYHWSLSLLGAVGCLAAMILIDPVAATVAAVVIVALYIRVSRRVVRSTFGDARRGFLYSVTIRNLLRLRDSSVHPKNWRPTFLVLSGNPNTRTTLVRYAIWLEAGRGIVTVAVILIGKLDELADRRRTVLDGLLRFIHEQELQAFPEAVVAGSLDEGISMLCQASSLSPLKPNTVLLGWPNESERVEPFAQHLRTIGLLGMSAISIMDRGLPRTSAGHKRIDIWWRGRENGSLMLILSHLLTRNWEWRRASIRIMRCIEDESGREQARESLSRLAAAGRVEAEVMVLVAEEEDAAQALRRASRESSVVIVGFQAPAQGEAGEWLARYEALLADMPTAILVSSSGDADLAA